MRREFTVSVLHPMGVDVRVDLQASNYLPSNTLFLLTPGARTEDIPRLRQAVEEERSRYANALKGLEYWRARALSEVK